MRLTCFRSWLMVLMVTGLMATVVAAAPPRVVSTSPEHGDKNVDPATPTITITFDQPMSQGGYSIVGGGPTFPEIGRARWVNNRTFALQVRLEPDHDYRLSINSSTYQSFRSQAGEPAVVYPLVFRTTSAGGAASEPARVTYTRGQQAEAIERMREAMRFHYAHFERFEIDWDRRIEAMAPSLVRQESPRRFASIANSFLRRAKDKHLVFRLDDGEVIPTYENPITPNIDTAWIRSSSYRFEQPLPHLTFAMFQGDVPYARIDSFSASDPYAFEPLFSFIGKNVDAEAIILDLRLNGGGSERVAQHLAGCFFDEPAVYATHVFRDNGLPGGFTDPMERVVEPNFGRPRFKGHVAVLTGPVVMSSAEAFVLMMRQAPRATIFGLTTHGSSGNPRAYPLGNGLTLYVPSWKSMTPEGEAFEGVGLEPEVEVKWERPGLLTPDPVIEAALNHFRKLR
ncbi:S41 family peptidase [Mucisphaera calidilacus]|uniref:Peptidase family S41 n=1 Tax=Mucisphaera calidilacus TaxID=2527982 RepID=A0A518C178_9BACT|nr:S41 family peptidase [Mucisphaera calidilacus]QDU72970.1 Peptidase family S41 [Mucisphaera calidilacus]